MSSIPVFETTLNRHETDIDKLKENYHSLDKTVDRINNALDKLDQVFENNQKLEVRVSALETIHTRREWWLNLIITILKWISKAWPLWLMLIVSLFAFDVEFKVQNPHLVSFFLDAVKNKI